MGEGAKNIMEFGHILRLVTAGGAVGGLAAGLSRVRLEALGFLFDEAFPASWPRWAAALLVPTAVGIVGAIGVQFAIVLITDGSRFEVGHLNEVFLFSISAAAGFGARTLLPLLSVTVEKQVASIADKTESINRTTQEMSGLVEEIREQTRGKQARDVAGSVIDHLMRGTAITDNQVEEALYDLESLVTRDPDNYHAERAIGVIRALRGELDDAEARFRALASKSKNKPHQPDRLYDTLLNIACIHGRKFSAGQQDLLPTIIHELQELARKDPRSASLILTEEDLAAVRATEEFQKIESTIKGRKARQ